MQHLECNLPRFAGRMTSDSLLPNLAESTAPPSRAGMTPPTQIRNRAYVDLTTAATKWFVTTIEPFPLFRYQRCFSLRQATLLST